MKKFYLIPVFLLSFLMTAFAQKASEGNQKFSKGVEGNAISITCIGQDKNVEDVIKDKMKEAKGKNGSTKGWNAVEQAVMPEFSEKTLDYYWKVEKAGNDESKIIFMISYGNDNFVGSKDDAPVINNVKSWLESMVEEIRQYELQIAIDEQTKVYEKELKEQEKLVEDGEDLVKDQEKLEKELEENKEEQEKNKKELEEQKKQVEQEKKILDELNKKLGSVGK